MHGSVGEVTDLGADPMTGFGGERIAQLAEALAVGAVREAADETRSAVVVPLLLEAAAEPHVDGLGRGGELGRGVEALGRTFLHGTLAGGALDEELAVGIAQADGGVVVAHNDQTGAVALVRGVEAELGGGGIGRGVDLLQQQVAVVGEVAPPLGAVVAVEPQLAGRGVGEVPPELGIGMPLPLQPQLAAVELVAVGRGLNGALYVRSGLLIRIDRLADAVAVAVDADDAPAVVGPRDGLQVRDAAVGVHVDEVEEPRIALDVVDPAALVGAGGLGVALVEHGAALVGPPRRLGAQDDLPAGLDAAGGSEDVVITVALIELGTLDRGMIAVAVEDHDVLADETLAVGRHLADAQHALEPGARTGPAVDEVGLAVVVPQGAGIDDAQDLFDEVRLRPLAARVLRLGHVDPDIGIAPIDVVPAVVVTDSRGPDALAVLRPIEVIVRRLRSEDGVDDLPVDQIGRVENLQTRHAVERRSGHPEVVAHARDVGVGIIGIEHGVLILPVAQIGRPDRLRRKRRRGPETEEKKQFFHR